MEENQNKKKYIMLFIILLLLLLFIYLFFIKKIGEDSSEEINNGLQQTETTDDDLTPEEVLEQLEGATFIGSDVQMSIVSPEEETFQMSQARNWEAQLDGIKTEKGLGALCNWQFYLNENNKEVLYEVMENRSSVSKDDPTLCGFTSTFIENRGKLRVKLTVDIRNAYGEVLDTFTAERRYTVL